MKICQAVLKLWSGHENCNTHTERERKDENIIPPWHTLYAGGIKIQPDLSYKIDQDIKNCFGRGNNSPCSIDTNDLQIWAQLFKISLA